MAAPFNQSLTLAGLSSYSFTALAAGPYVLDWKSYLPTITNGGGASSVVAIVNQNASPVYTGVAGAEGGKAEISCAVNDVIQIIFSSANANDQGLNAVKSNIAISQGVS